MLNTLSKFFSYLFHPFFVPLYGYSLLLFSDNYYAYFFPLKNKLLLLAIVFSFTCLLPALNLIILLKMRIIHSLKLEENEQRTFPYLITAFFYFGMSYMIWKYSLPSVFKSLIISGGISILLTTLVNLRWKISAHLIAFGGLTGATMAISFILKQNFLSWLYLIIAISGLLGFARLKLNAHTPAQVYVGYISGLLLTFILVILFYIIDITQFF